MTTTRLTAAAVLAALALSSVGAQTPASFFTGRPRLHAHNAYPDEGRWADRLDRALATPLSPVVVEQDVAWSGQASVVSHDDTLSGAEPSLEDHFFERVRPTIERALADGRRDAWPVVVLHLDFKTNEPEHHQAVWALLLKYRRWLMTAPRGSDPAAIMPMTPGPLLVLTENGENQERDFFTSRPADQPLLIFGAVPNAPVFRIEDASRRAGTRHPLLHVERS